MLLAIVERDGLCVQPTQISIIGGLRSCVQPQCVIGHACYHWDHHGMVRANIPFAISCLPLTHSPPREATYTPGKPRLHY